MVVLLVGQALFVSLIVSGRFLTRQKKFWFLFACLACAGFPFGTMLGVSTIIGLAGRLVKGLYGKRLGDF
jgi:hypothetical protein